MPTDSEMLQDEQKEREAWKAIQEEAQKKEFEEWDAKFSKTKATEERSTEIDS
jgi:hypothetical protein